MDPLNLLECINEREDFRFDLVYPPETRVRSSVHWTPVGIARLAAEFLVRKPGTRVLDIACGPGKFGAVGALTTQGRFTGIEQRKDLCEQARSLIGRGGITNAEIIHGNVTDIDFSNFDAFYLFNPFEENLETILKIDSNIKLSSTLYERYTEHVARQLAIAPLGTRVATYCGVCEEVPLGYQPVVRSFNSNLKLWEKTNHYPVRSKPLETTPQDDECRAMSAAI